MVQVASPHYPQCRGTFLERLKVAWRILRHGEFFPQPRPWYEALDTLVSSDLSHWAEMAVEKSDAEATRGLPLEKRREEAIKWTTLYRRELSREPITPVKERIIAFLVEWWVCRKANVF